MNMIDKKEVLTDVSVLVQGIDLSGYHHFCPENNHKASKQYNNNDANWARLLPAEVKELQRDDPNFKPFDGFTVIDLGAGSDTFGLYAAIRMGAIGYVAVEPCNGKSLYNDVSCDNSLVERLQSESKRGRFAIAPEDMLTFLQRIPDSSVAVMSSGIDGSILEFEYMRQVEGEVERVLSPESAYLAHLSHIHPKGLDCAVEIPTDNPFHMGLKKLYVQPRA